MALKQTIIEALRLINTDGIGPVNYEKYISAYGSVADALVFLEKAGKKVPSSSWAENELNNAEKQNVHLLLKEDNLYPQKLLSLKDAPPVLYAKGNLNLLSTDLSLAIVGSRNASINARKLSSKIACDLTENKILVISGMARGIDASAHKGAMYALNQKGPTIAVLGTGIDKIYPTENKDLYYQIAEQGLLLSEVPLGTEAQISNFPRRNRIVSGLSCGVLVTEASEKSGSLITAKLGAQQGKHLFAVPGNPCDAKSAGTNNLLRMGAHFTENADDIINILKNCAVNPPTYKVEKICDDLFINSLDNSAKTNNIPSSSKYPIEEFLSTSAADIDEIIRYSKLDTATVMMQILDLEIEGRIVRLPGNKIALSERK